ncbi:hypothetical protein FMN63_20440 [Stappia sp. BW2]|uniref:hypothetical protein n=1 Tax=Stappia sp. BW2 TaxID=2592622 RepID=UPI0011DE7C9B|nr:hypothetical protein [Stappia sp. BW2]TYC64830.1 hypothetical protein FMN63_20440 [Stappia sp. BW2]
MSDNERSGDKDPFLLRLVDAVDFTISVLTADIWFVVVGLLVALLFGATLLGLLLEFAIGAFVLGVIAFGFWLYSEWGPFE